MTPIIEGHSRVLDNAGVPVAGTDEVQTLTIGGTPTGGTFTLSFGGFTTGAITWSAVNATLLTSTNTALDALASTGGAGGVVATAGTLVAGIGTILLTFSGGNVAKRAQPTMTATSSLVGTAPTLAVAETTPGVNASGMGQGKGALIRDTANGKIYSNIGTAAAPSWQAVGLQT